MRLRPCTLLVLVLAPIIMGITAHDVANANWYDEPVKEFFRKGYFDPDIAFRPGDIVTKSEFVELIINLRGGADESIDIEESFDDITTSNPYYKHFEEAGRQGWLKGEKNCYGTHPCYVHSQDHINRAEAAALMMRAFGVQRSLQAPTFSDVQDGEWYTEHISNAASICVLSGDDASTRVRPSSNINRAEMIVMLYRLHARLKYPACDMQKGSVAIPTATAMSYTKENRIGSTWDMWETNSPAGKVTVINGFAAPYGLQISQDGALFVIDSIANKIVWFDQFLQFKKTIEGNLNFPHAVTIDQEGIILVADYRNGRIVRFKKNGEFLDLFFDNPPSTELSLIGPVNVYVDDMQNIWVTDYKANRIVKFKRDGTLVGWKGENDKGGITDGFVTSGSAQESGTYGGFNQPHMVATDQNGHIFVVDTGNHRVQKFATDGTFLGWIGARRDNDVTNGWSINGISVSSEIPGGFNRPTAIHWNNEDRLLIVTDTENNRIQKFSEDGLFAGWIGKQRGGTVTTGWEMEGTAESGEEPGAFLSPFYAQLHDGLLYVADTGNRRIQIIKIRN